MRDRAVTRERILEAAADVLREQGLVRTTTKEIARATGCSEATLYQHFPTKQELLAAAASRGFLPDLVEFARDLPLRAGTATVRDNLAELVQVALAFYTEVVPMSARILADPALLAAQQEHMRAHDVGPHKVFAAVRAYLAAEQGHRRIRPEADLHAAVMLVLGACYLRAFSQHFDPPSVAEISDEYFVAGLLDTLVPNLELQT